MIFQDMKLDTAFKVHFINNKYNINRKLNIMTNKINTSPDKGSFIKENRLKQLIASNTEPTDDEYFNLLLSFEQQKIEMENEPEWQKNNLEFDLRSTEWIIEKVKRSEQYAQNLYAALCNNEFVQLENSWNILKEEYWSCSWRSSGGIVADIQEHGDYIDWYCSGIRDSDDNTKGYVSESVVTEEIKNDLKTLGWVVIQNNDNI